MPDTALPAVDDGFVDRLLARPETATFECKRIGKVGLRRYAKPETAPDDHPLLKLFSDLHGKEPEEYP